MEPGQGVAKAVGSEEGEAGEGHSPVVSPPREDAGRENTIESYPPERGFTSTREWGRRKTLSGGWAEYYAETASIRDEKTGATAERAYVFARGETGEGNRVTGVGRADGAEFPAWVEGDEGWFEEIYVRAERSSVVEKWETDRPVEASLIMLPPGADVREELRITRDPALRNLRAFGWSREFWTDSEGYPTIRSTKWLILQRDEDREQRSAVGGRMRLIVVARTDVIQLRPERDLVNRSSHFIFFPLDGGEGREAKGSTQHQRGEGGGEAGGQLWTSLFLGDRDEGGSRNDYRFEGGFTQLVYRPPENGDEHKAKETGEAKETGAVCITEGSVASEETATGFFQGIEKDTAGKTAEDALVEFSGNVEEASGAADANEAVKALESTEEAFCQAEETEVSDAGETGVSAASESREEPAERSERTALVELDNGKEVSVESILKMVGMGIFRAGSDEEYQRRLREKGIEFDYRKLGETLLKQRKLPEEVYRALKSLAEGEKKESQERKATSTLGEDHDTVNTPTRVEESEGEEDKGKTLGEQQEQEQRERLSLEDLFVIISNVVRG
ncbi:MAG: hypothetical protein ACTSV0_05790 [Candidatus Freyarchaeota archaeon]